MVFSVDKWNDAEELRQYIPVSAALSFEKVESSLNDAFRLFILSTFGQKIADRIVSIYQATERKPEETALLEECQRAVASLAFWYNYTELNVRITDQGIQRQESSEGTFKQAYKYQEDQLRHSFRNKGLSAIDRIFDILEENQQTFTEYADSPACTQRAKSIVRSTGEVNQCCFINYSHILFLRLKPLFKTVEETILQPILGVDLYKALTKALAEGATNIGDTTVEELRHRCSCFVIYKAAAQLIRTTGSLTDRGLYFARLTAGDGNLRMEPADRETSLSQAAEYERQATAYHDLLLTFIETYLPTYFKGRQSQVLNRDNNHKRTFWA